MKAFAPKSKTESSQTKPTNQRPRHQDRLSAKGNASQASVHVDNRPTAKRRLELQAMAAANPRVQRMAELQATANNSPRVQRLTQLQAMAAQSPRVKRLAELQAMANNSPRVKAQAELQTMVDNSPRQVAQRQRMEHLFGPTLQRQEGLEEDELQMKVVQKKDREEEELLQGKMEPVQRQEDLEEDEELLQGRFADSEAPAQQHETEKSAVNRTGIPDPLKAGLEQPSGMDLSDVRVHHNSDKPAQLNALAYAQGKDIHLGPGQEQHLPHEGWHAVQQMQGRVKPTMQAKSLAINDDEGLEREADVMGAKAAKKNQIDQQATMERIGPLQSDASYINGQKHVIQGMFWEKTWNGEYKFHYYPAISRWWFDTHEEHKGYGVYLRRSDLTRDKIKERIATKNPSLSDKDLKIQTSLVNYMSRINTGSIPFRYPGDGDSKFETDAKHFEATKGGIRYQGQCPAKALRDLVASVTVLDCTRSAKIGMYLAELEHLSDAAFDLKYGGKYISFAFAGISADAPQGENYETVEINDQDDLIAGDWVYFYNHPRYIKDNPGGLWSGENAYYMGNGMFQGFGTTLLTYQEMCKKLTEAYMNENHGKLTLIDIFQKVFMRKKVFRLKALR